MKKKILIGLVLVLVVMQFIPSGAPETSDDLSKDLIANNEIPDDVAAILKTSCYDCHSTQTDYRWYSHIAPVSFLVAKDVREGKEHLNFSEWENLSKMDKAEALDELGEEVEEGEMPMKIYFITHSDATLSDEQRTRLVDWAEEFAEALFE
jgi:hypothetical protein